jgi:predicted ABC-type sugar transport system permease subunit
MRRAAITLVANCYVARTPAKMIGLSASEDSTSCSWRQFSLRSLLVFVLICALFGALLSWWLRPKILDAGYFPIGVGYRWVYASRGGNTQDDVVFEVVGTEKVGNTNWFVVLRSIGDHQIKFYVEVTDRAVLIHQVGQDRYRPAYPQFRINKKRTIAGVGKV